MRKLIMQWILGQILDNTFILYSTETVMCCFATTTQNSIVGIVVLYTHHANIQNKTQ